MGGAFTGFLSLFLLVAIVGGGEEADDGEEEVDIAFDTFDGEHGDSFEGHEEADGGEQAAVEEVRATGVDDEFHHRQQEDHHVISNHNPDACNGDKVVGDAGGGSTEEHHGDDPTPFAPLLLAQSHAVALVGYDMQQDVEHAVGHIT